MGRLFFFLIIVCTVIYSLLNPGTTNTIVLETLSLWLLMVLPSILPMYLLSHFLIRIPLFTKVLYPLLKPILHLENHTSCAIYLVSILAGNPTAASLIASAADKNLISKEEANRLVKFSSFVSPLFIIAFSNKLHPGISLFFIFSQILASILIANFLPSNKGNRAKIEHSITTEAISEILSSAPSVLLNIGVTMVMVNIIKAPLLKLMNFNSFYLKYILSLLEISTGLNDIINASLPLTTSMILFSILFSLSGVAIHLQVITVISKKKISYTNFFWYRLIHMAIALTIILFMIFHLVLIILILIGLIILINSLVKKKEKVLWQRVLPPSTNSFT